MLTECYGRLYFRPLTPTQYHNEGYKPIEVRDSDINACCPVPIFLCLGANATLGLQGAKFAEKGLAGNRGDICEGIEAFSNLNFNKIYHYGAYTHENSDIKEYRHSEVVREGGFPVEPLLRCILCRSQAERETLLFLLKQYSLRLYNTYKSKVLYNPSLLCFYNNGIFVKNVEINNDILSVHFNDPEQRFNKQNSLMVGLRAEIQLSYRGDDGSVMAVQNGTAELDYNCVRSCSIRLKRELHYSALRVNLRINDAIMYENELFIRNAIF